MGHSDTADQEMDMALGHQTALELGQAVHGQSGGELEHVLQAHGLVSVVGLIEE